MFSEKTKPKHHSDEEDMQKTLDREVKDMVDSLTARLTDLQKPGGSHQHHQLDEDERGVRIITLAGNNTGATMRSEQLDEQKASNPDEEPDKLDTYVNSNFQAVNNSIMLNSHYNTNDPGVHLEISDVLEQNPQKHAKKGKKKDKEKEAFRSDQQTDHSD